MKDGRLTWGVFVGYVEDPLDDFIHVVEGVLPVHEGVKSHAQRPHLHLIASVPLERDGGSWVNGGKGKGLLEGKEWGCITEERKGEW